MIEPGKRLESMEHETSFTGKSKVLLFIRNVISEAELMAMKNYYLTQNGVRREKNRIIVENIRDINGFKVKVITKLLLYIRFKQQSLYKLYLK